MGGEGWGVIRDEEVTRRGGGAARADRGRGGERPLHVGVDLAADAAVTVTLTPSAGVTLDGSSLTFMTGDWATARTVTVTAQHDADAVAGLPPWPTRSRRRLCRREGG